MKIEKVLFTIDDNPHYKGFWKSISKHFKTRLGMDSKLFVIGDENTDMSAYSTEYGETELTMKIDGIPTIIQALLGKFYFTLSEPDTVWMVGDLDLYPLQKSYFVDTIKDISDEMYVHLNSWAYGKQWREKVNGLAGYYHVAKGSTFKEELNITSPEDFCNAVYKTEKYGIKFIGVTENRANREASKNDHGWFCCEEMYTGELLRDCKKLVEINPRLPFELGVRQMTVRDLRVDRSDMKWDQDVLERGIYIDMHAPRPYEAYAHVIEKIAKAPFGI